jgi:hypothetical protein
LPLELNATGVHLPKFLIRQLSSNGMIGFLSAIPDQFAYASASSNPQGDVRFGS